MTESEYVKKLEAVYAEIGALEEDIKSIKNDAKDEGFKPTKLAKIAKLRAQCKTGKFVQEVKELVETIEQNDL